MSVGRGGPETLFIAAVLRLLRGGLRAFTGLIGKTQPRNVRFTTSVATIGIRGTGMDLSCQGSCAEEPGEAPPPDGDGLALLTGLLVLSAPLAAAAQASQGSQVYRCPGPPVLYTDALSAKVILSGKLGRKIVLKGVGATKGARAAIEAAGGSVAEIAAA